MLAQEKIQSNSSIRAVFKMFEPCDGKQSRTVLSGEQGGVSPLPCLVCKLQMEDKHHET